MRCQVLGDTGFGSDFFKIRVHSLVGNHGYHQIFCGGFRVVAVFLGYPHRDFEQRDHAHLARFLTGLAYPYLAVLIGLYLVVRQRRDVHEGKPGETAEHECVTHEVKPGQGCQVKVYYALQLNLREFLSFRLGTGVPFAYEWIIVNPFVGDTHLHDILEIADVFHGGVVGAAFLHAEKMLEVVNQTRCELFHRNVFHTLLVKQEFLQIFDTPFPTQPCSLAHIAAFLFFAHLPVDLAENLTQHLRLFKFAEEGAFQHIRVYQFLAHHKLAVYLADFCADGVEVVVELLVFLALAFGLTFRCVPVFGQHIPVGIDFRTLSVHRDPEGDGHLSLLV